MEVLRQNSSERAEYGGTTTVTRVQSLAELTGHKDTTKHKTNASNPPGSGSGPNPISAYIYYIYIYV